MRDPAMRERIAVIGAGIVGCVIIREILAAFPGAEITVVERDLVGLGASQRSAGLHFPTGRTERVRAMAKASEDYYRDLAADDPSLPIYPVALYAVAFGAAARTVRGNFIEPGAIETAPPDRHGPMPWPAGASLWSVPNCHYADVGALAGRLAHDFRPAITLLEGVAVVGIEERLGGVAVTLATGDSLAVDRVILAPGPWMNEPAWRELLSPLGIRVKKIVAFHLDHPTTDTDTAIMFPEEDAFLLPLRHRGHWLYSYTCLEWDLDPDAPRLGVSRQNIEEGRAVLDRYAPELAGKLRSGRVFCDAYGPAREPIITRVGTNGQILFAGAANGSGYRLAPAIAAETLLLLD
ncbi:MAG: FAD-dependent oxidoreductase [Aliidongia sp.]